MLSINVPLAFVAMSTMPFIYFLGVRMRRSMFPVSWLIQSRLADVATIVDENINGVRVVKSFAAEDQQLKHLARAADRLQWAYVKDADLRARFTPLVQNLVQVGLALVLLLGGYLVIHDNLQVGAILTLQLLDRHAAAALPDARHADHAGPAGLGLGRADLRDPRRAADVVDRPGRRRPGRHRRRRPLRRRDLRVHRGRPGGPRALQHAPASWRDRGPGRAHRRAASRRSPACSPGSTT